MTNYYECVVCNYKTNDRSNLYNHNKTKKHLKNTSKLIPNKCANIVAPQNSSKLLKTPQNS